MYELSFLDMLILRLVVFEYHKNNRPVKVRELLNAEGGKHEGLINDALKEAKILNLPLAQRLKLSDTVRSMRTVHGSLVVLRQMKLIDERQMPTKRGIALNSDILCTYAKLTDYPSSIILDSDFQIIKEAR